MKNNHVTKYQFVLEFFGLIGRNFGDPEQWFTDNPMDIFGHIEKCAREEKPCFISVQPMVEYQVLAGIEKIFYDFDYGRKSDKLSPKQISKHTIKLENEIKIFLYRLSEEGIIPLVVKTRKGYHVYIYFDKIYEIKIHNKEDEEFWRYVYKEMHRRFIKGKRYKFKYVDTTSKMDIKRLCRVPTSIHQKSKEECVILDANLKPTKFRSIEYYRVHGIKRDVLISAVEQTLIDEEKRKKKMEQIESEREDKWEVSHGFVGEIRPCFRRFMEAGEASHQVRLAMAIEAFYSGYKTREVMVDWFRWGNDWDGHDPKGNCWTQVNWFFDNKVDETRKGEPVCRARPYKCDTIMEKGWCLKDNCPIYRRRMEKNA